MCAVTINGLAIPVQGEPNRVTFSPGSRRQPASPPSSFSPTLRTSTLAYCGRTAESSSRRARTAQVRSSCSTACCTTSHGELRALTFARSSLEPTFAAQPATVRSRRPSRAPRASSQRGGIAIGSTDPWSSASPANAAINYGSRHGCEPKAPEGQTGMVKAALPF